MLEKDPDSDIRIRGSEILIRKEIFTDPHHCFDHKKVKVGATFHFAEWLSANVSFFVCSDHSSFFFLVNDIITLTTMSLFVKCRATRTILFRGKCIFVQQEKIRTFMLDVRNSRIRYK
jgi:hypothetical protein